MKLRILAALMVGVLSAQAPAQLAIVGKTVHTMGPAGTIADGVVLIDKSGKITGVGPAASTKIPDGWRTLRADVVTPGLVDAHGTVGLSGIFNQRHDSDQLERSGPVQPELRALDAYNPLDKLVEYLRSFGVTTVHTGHAPGELISGQTIIVKTAGNTVEEAKLVETAMVAATLGPGATKEGGKAPGTRGKEISMLREWFVKAAEYDKKQQTAPADKKPPRDLRLETLARVLRGELPLLVTAQRAQDIDSALRLGHEFKIRVILDGAAEAYMLIDRIKETKTPVIIHPPMTRAFGETENASFTTVAKLREAGIAVAFQSGYEGYVPKTRVVLLEAGVASGRAGVSPRDALAMITIDAAKILGIEDRVGSLEVGKHGDAALYDGDPLEYTTHCVGTVIGGKVVWEGKR